MGTEWGHNMAWIEFNGVKSSDMGVIIESMPSFGKPARRFSSETVSGMDGSLFMIEDAYENIESSIVINSFGNDPRIIYNWLDGIGNLKTSDSPDKIRRVRCLKAQTQKRLRFAQPYDSITVPVIGDPYCMDTANAPITITNPMVLNGQGDVDSVPLISVTGTGDVTVMIGRCTMLIDFGTATKTVVIDCTARAAIVDGENAYHAGVNVSFINDDPLTRWASLKHDGANAISYTGSVQNVSITPNWRYFG